ncbi:unnamed protein product [Darwinula stevensoni]|uniref:ZP domain-containing protein n=1 Tax=Darwinula stevensoni TaxID=69355 RepID=A0A7R8WY66_9CRUS|nr:unnamed protein product [Darwinula stevensoni]CAG0879008.1 unnamed protein product [Darwinula stevensoni]
MRLCTFGLRSQDVWRNGASLELLMRALEGGEGEGDSAWYERDFCPGLSVSPHRPASLDLGSAVTFSGAYASDLRPAPLESEWVEALGMEQVPMERGCHSRQVSPAKKEEIHFLHLDLDPLLHRDSKSKPEVELELVGGEEEWEMGKVVIGLDSDFPVKWVIVPPSMRPPTKKSTIIWRTQGETSAHRIIVADMEQTRGNRIQRSVPSVCMEGPVRVYTRERNQKGDSGMHPGRQHLCVEGVKYDEAPPDHARLISCSPLKSPFTHNGIMIVGSHFFPNAASPQKLQLLPPRPLLSPPIPPSPHPLSHLSTRSSISPLLLHFPTPSHQFRPSTSPARIVRSVHGFEVGKGGELVLWGGEDTALERRKKKTGTAFLRTILRRYEALSSFAYLRYPLQRIRLHLATGWNRAWKCDPDSRDVHDIHHVTAWKKIPKSVDGCFNQLHWGSNSKDVHLLEAVGEQRLRLSILLRPCFHPLSENKGNVTLLLKGNRAWEIRVHHLLHRPHVTVVAEGEVSNPEDHLVFYVESTEFPDEFDKLLLHATLHYGLPASYIRISDPTVDTLELCLAPKDPNLVGALSVRCGNSGFLLTVPLRVLKQIHIKPEQLTVRIRKRNCVEPHRNRTHVLLEIPYNDCGTNIYSLGSSFSYVNHVRILTKLDTKWDGEKQPLTIMLQCKYGLLDLPSSPRLLQEEADGQGEVKHKIEVVDWEKRRPLPPLSTFTWSQRVYIRISTLGLERFDGGEAKMETMMNRCWVSDSHGHGEMGKQNLMLLDTNCSLSSASSARLFKSHHHPILAFSIADAFKGFESFYIFCEVGLCSRRGITETSDMPSLFESPNANEEDQVGNLKGGAKYLPPYLQTKPANAFGRKEDVGRSQSKFFALGLFIFASNHIHPRPLPPFYRMVGTKAMD